MSDIPPNMHAGSDQGSASPERSNGYYIGVLVVVLLFSEANVFTAVIFYNALRFMSPPFTAAELPWIVSISLLVAAALQPLMGKIADVFGFRRTIAVVALVYVAGSLLGALTTSFALIMVARILQAGIIALPGAVYAFFRSFFPKRMIPVLIGMNMTGIGIAAMVGPLIAGALLSVFSYHAMFWFCLIYMAIVAPMTLIVVPRGGPRLRARIDVPGSMLVTIGFGALLLSLTEGSELGWGAPLTVGLYALTALALVAFVITELRVREPMIDIRLLAHHALRNSLLVSFFTAIPIAAWQYLFPQLLSPLRAAGTDYGFGLTALQVGLANLPFGVMSTVTGPIGGLLCRRYSPRAVMMASAGLGLVASVGTGLWHSSLWEVVLWGAVMGVVFGFYFASGPNLIIEAVPARLTGVTTGLQAFTSSLPNSAMPVVVGTVLAANVLRVSSTAHQPVYSSQGYLYVYLLLALGAAVGLAVAVLMRHGRQPAMGGFIEQPAGAIASVARVAADNT
jgi:MFS family permease